MPAKARPRSSAARADAVALPRLRPRQAWLRLLLLRLAPSRRSLAIGLGIVAFALGAYALARETSLFAIRRIDVSGGSRSLAAQVRHALAPLNGKSLVGLDGTAVMRRVEALPSVVRASYDRAFPNTLRITVVPERPAAVVRAGRDTWLVSRRGRVIERLPSRGDPGLPRIWLPGRTPLRVGQRLGPSEGAAAARAAARAGPFATRVGSVSFANHVLVFRLRSGIELLLGSAADVRLKVAVAQRALTVLPAGSTFLDVTVPGRPVSGTGQPFRVAQGSSRG